MIVVIVIYCIGAIWWWVSMICSSLKQRDTLDGAGLLFMSSLAPIWPLPLAIVLGSRLHRKWKSWRAAEEGK